MPMKIPTIDDVEKAATVLRQHLSPAPLIRSYPLERELRLPATRRVWVKDYGWTPVGSFKIYGALNWMANNVEAVGDRPVVAHSSGNFASAISCATHTYGKRLIVVMPDNAPRIKFERTRSFGADIRTFDAANDHKTGRREGMAREIEQEEQAVLAAPYDDPHVIAGNGVGGLEIVQDLRRQERGLSHFVCAVSGGGLMSGHCLSIGDAFPQAQIVGVEPAGANDFQQSLAAGEIVRIDHPQSICDGLLSYSVGHHNWPILKQHVAYSVEVADDTTRQAMRWLYDQHGVRSEPSGTVGLAAVLDGRVNLEGDGDVVIVVSGRNIDEDRFREWIA
jgi:threonine dehydratase